MLEPMRAVTPEPLFWAQPRRFRHEYELRAGRDVVATLRWRGILSWDALGETAEGRYRLRLANFLRGTVVVHPGDSDVEAAVFRSRFFGGGTVRVAGGRTFRMRPLDFWHRRFILEDEAGAAVFRLRMRYAFLRDQATVELEPGAERVPELPVLLLLTWYVGLRARRRHRR
jgi:hypothetical protein